MTAAEIESALIPTEQAASEKLLSPEQVLQLEQQARQKGLNLRRLAMNMMSITNGCRKLTAKMLTAALL